jgi:poly(A) polymerase
MTSSLPISNGKLAGPSVMDDARVARIFATFDGDGERTRIVGGAVRNSILREAVSEIDFATTALPHEIIRRADAAGLRSVPTGLEHGTITVIVAGTPFEITTLREDVETDGRRARVRFGRSFEHDALRRDFTINALSLDAEGHIHDYTGGLDDIAARHVRFIGEARQRIREDYLRILRFFRFHAAYGRDTMDADAFHAIIAEREGLAILSRERVRAELMKLLLAARAPDVIADMSHAGILQPILGGIALPRRLAALCAIERAARPAPDAELRWIALFVQVREDAERLRERLRMSNAETQRGVDAARALERLHNRSQPPAPSELREMLFEFGQQGALDAMQLAQAESDAPADDAAWANARAFLSDTPVPTLPFRGSDLMARGVPPGQAIGKTLKHLQARWIRAGFPKDPATLAQLLQETLDRPD